MSVKLLKSLLFKISQIQMQIEREQQRPRADWLRLLRLKKVRLLLSERLYLMFGIPPHRLQPCRVNQRR